MVVLHQDGQDAAHFVDSVGFREVPEFYRSRSSLPRRLGNGRNCQNTERDFPCNRYEPGADRSRRIWLSPPVGRRKVSDYGEWDAGVAVAAEQAQRDNPLKTAEQTIEQNGNMIDGIINNTPTVDELEAKVKAGEQISLVDLANAVKPTRSAARERSGKETLYPGAARATRKRHRRKTQSRSHRTWKGADPCRNRANLKTWICLLPLKRL